MTAERADRRYDVIVVGGGHNGLVCASYLAMDGLRVLVLERRPVTGGLLDAGELAPGVRAPLVNSVGRLRPRIARDLRLADRGLRLVRPEVRLTSLVPDGPPLSLWADTQRTVDELRAHWSADAETYAGFDEETRAFGAVMARINSQPPPDVERLRSSDLISSMRLWFGYRGLGARRARELLRVLPMALADHLDDNFESRQLQAALAWRGVRYTSLAASDAGSTQVFLSDGAGTGDGAAGEMVVARGGPAALSAALTGAAEANGAEIRVGAEVRQLIVHHGRTTGVVLADGEEISARAVVSGLDPKRTLLDLVDPAALGPMLGWEVDNLRQGGGTAAVQLALDGLPAFIGVASDEARQRLAGRLLVAPDTRTLDRAADAIKAGRIADTLVLEATIPTLVDSSLVDQGAKASHVMSVLVHGAPYHLRDGDWDAQRDALGDRVVDQLEAVAPGLRAMVVGRRVLTPLDLERDYGLTEGHALHGEPSLDQWFAWRPMFGHARYRMPLDGLYLCGSGAHPGGGVTGTPGQLAAEEVLVDWARRTR
jgi:phytoene dehydrogenase-like protein